MLMQSSTLSPLIRCRSQNPGKIPEPNVVEREVIESSSKKKTYQYIPSNQRKKGDPIFRVIDKSNDMKGTNFPTPLPPLEQYRIKQSQKESRCSNVGGSENKNTTQIFA